MSGESFFSRWSRRKRSSAGRDMGTADATPASTAGRDAPTADAVPAQALTRSVAPTSNPAPLPDVASLTPDSDFAPFMRADVDPTTKAQALKTLFSDARFNVMDGLDVYIDDYSKPDPLPEGWLDKLEQVKHLGIFREPDAAADEAAQAAEQTAATAQDQPQRLESAPPPGEVAAPPAESPITLGNVRTSDLSKG